MSVETPLVLLHFFGSSHREWDQVRARLAPNRCVLAPDLPGFGDAATRPPADVAGMADFVERAIADAALPSCVLVGHSMSAKVAAVLAARAPSWLRGLVLVAASPPSPEPMRDDAKAKLLAFDGSRAAAANYVDGVTASRLPDDLRDRAIDDAMRASLAAWKAWVVDGSQGRLGVARRCARPADAGRRRCRRSLARRAHPARPGPAALPDGEPGSSSTVAMRCRSRTQTPCTARSPRSSRASISHSPRRSAA